MELSKNEKLFSKEFFINYAWLLGGCFIFALGNVLFAEPYGFAPGGTYGLSIVFHHLFGWRTEVSALSMDIPLLIIGFIFLGRKFGVKTIVCTFVIPVFMSLVHKFYGFQALLEPEIVEREMLQEQFLSALFGGIVYGVGLGLIFRSGATSGGSDIISMILHKYTQISLGTLVIIVDCTITLTTVVAFGDWRLPMYSWILIFVEGKVIDMVVEGGNSYKTLMIISNHTNQIKSYIVNEINVNATIIDEKIVYTILSRKQLTKLHQYVKAQELEAIINVIDSKEVIKCE